MAGQLEDPREAVAGEAGLGGYGNDFNSQDSEFQALRMKARKVLDGRGKFTMDELQKLMARLLIGR